MRSFTFHYKILPFTAVISHVIILVWHICRCHRHCDIAESHLVWYLCNCDLKTPISKVAEGMSIAAQRHIPIPIDWYTDPWSGMLLLCCWYSTWRYVPLEIVMALKDCWMGPAPWRLCKCATRLVLPWTCIDASLSRLACCCDTEAHLYKEL